MGITCDLCLESCVLQEGESGRCGVRANVGGEVRLTHYEIVSSILLDPIERKPFFHFMPGSKVLSVGGFGCNMGCGFCQNFSISQTTAGESTYMSPVDIVELAKEKEASAIAFTYNEPLVWIEYVIDVSLVARTHGLRVLVKTNGYAARRHFFRLLGHVDAINMDIKGDQVAYADTCDCKAIFRDILANAADARRSGHLEISIPVMPGTAGRLRSVLGELCLAVGSKTPIHMLRFFPDFKMRHLAPTSPSEMDEAALCASLLFENIYVHGMEHDNDTRCRSCGYVLVKRKASLPIEVNINEGKCQRCGQPTGIETESLNVV